MRGKPKAPLNTLASPDIRFGLTDGAVTAELRGMLRFDTTPIDTALRPVSACTTGWENDPKLGKKAKKRTPPVSK